LICRWKNVAVDLRILAFSATGCCGRLGVSDV
jgi:hypothetical protein